MYTPHVVTLYNVYEDDNGDVQIGITILKNVMLQNSKADNVNKSGLQNADSATLFIPFNVNVVDVGANSAVAGIAVAGQSIVGHGSKTFLKPKAFRYSEDKESHWTLVSQGTESDHDCFFIKGEVIDANGYAYMREHYDDVYKVTSVDYRDFGSASMRHWQVGAR